MRGTILIRGQVSKGRPRKREICVQPLEMGLFRVVATGTPRGRIGCFRLSLVPARPQFLPVPWSGCATCLRGASTLEAWGEALLHEGVASTRPLFTASPQGTKRGTQ